MNLLKQKLKQQKLPVLKKIVRQFSSQVTKFKFKPSILDDNAKIKEWEKIHSENQKK